MVARQLQHDRHDLRFVDLMRERDPVTTALRELRDLQPDLVCALIRNRDNQWMRKYDDPLPRIRELLAAVRATTTAPLLLGGTAFTTFPRRMLDYMRADYGIAGDSLHAISHFVRSFGTNGNGDSAPRPDLDTPGLVFRGESGEIIERPFTIAGYPRVRFDYHDLIEKKRYRRCYWEAAVITRSGCPEKCTYCDTYRTFWREFTLRDPGDIAEELLQLKRKGGVHFVWLIDAGFNRPLDHAEETLREIIRRGAQLRLYAIFDPGQADREFFRLSRRAGGVGFTMFAESLADPVLEALGKSFGTAEIFRDARTIREEGQGFMFMPTFGGPGRNTRDCGRDAASNASLKALVVVFGIGWRLLPETQLQQRAIDEGVIRADDVLWNATFYISPATPLKWIEQRIRAFRWWHPITFGPMIPFALRMMFQRPWKWESVSIETDSREFTSHS